MSVVSVPTTIAATSLKNSKNFFQPLNQAFETIKTQGQTSFDGFDTNLKNQYVDFGNNAIDNTKGGLGEIRNKIGTMQTLGKPNSDQLKEKAENINYYAFQLGDLVKALIKSVPTIIRDTVLLIAKGDANMHLLSAHKLYFIAANENFSSFVTSLANVVTKYASIMSKLSGEDTEGIIQIFRELSFGDIENFLKKVKTNSETLGNASDYCNATKLMMHVLIGKEKIEKMKTDIENLKTKLTTMESSLKDIISGLSIDLNDLKSQLEKLSQSPQIQDPCKKQT